MQHIFMSQDVKLSYTGVKNVAKQTVIYIGQKYPVPNCGICN